MSFHVSYAGSPAAQSAIRKALEARGLRPALPRDPRCVVQWAAFSKVAWDRHMSGIETMKTTVDVGAAAAVGAAGAACEPGVSSLTCAADPRPLFVSAFPVRTALVNKRALSSLLSAVLSATRDGSAERRFLARCFSPTVSVTPPPPATCDCAATAAALPREPFLAPVVPWVLKDSRANNALGIRFCLLPAHPGVAMAAAAAFRAGSLCGRPRGIDADEFDSQVLQRYVFDPVLSPDGCKFHLRVNVLVCGLGPGAGAWNDDPALPAAAARCKTGVAVYVHRDVVCHTACERWRPLDMDSADDAGAEDAAAAAAAAALTRFVHLTNNSVQRSHPAYRREQHTITLAEMCQRWQKSATCPAPSDSEELGRGVTGAVAADLSAAKSATGAPGLQAAPSSRVRMCERLIMARICAVVRLLFEGLDRQRAPKPPGAAEAGSAASTRSAFVPAPNAFEVFGFDFLLSERGMSQWSGEAGAVGAEPSSAASQDVGPWPVLLEVNGGPALEGAAWPDLCREVVEDTVRVAVDPWLGELRQAAGLPPTPLSPHDAPPSGGRSLDAAIAATDSVSCASGHACCADAAVACSTAERAPGLGAAYHHVYTTQGFAHADTAPATFLGTSTSAASPEPTASHLTSAFRRHALWALQSESTAEED